MENLDQEMLSYFLIEADVLVKQCREALNQFNLDGEAKNFADFGGYIDRMMGAALTMEISNIGEIAKLGKELGYKGSQVTDQDSLFAIMSLLSQLMKEIEKGIKSVKKGEVKTTPEQDALLKKLKKASDDLGNLRSSVGNV